MKFRWNKRSLAAGCFANKGHIDAIKRSSWLDRAFADCEVNVRDVRDFGYAMKNCVPRRDTTLRGL